MNNEQYGRLIAILNDSELRGEVSDLALALRDEGLDPVSIKKVVKLSRDSRRKGDTILHQCGIQPEKQARATERRKTKAKAKATAKPAKRSKSKELPGVWKLERMEDFKGQRMFRIHSPSGRWEQLGENKLQARVEFFSQYGERLAKLLTANSKEGSTAKLSTSTLYR